MWNENISCRIIKQDMSQPSTISGLQMWMKKWNESRSVVSDSLRPHEIYSPQNCPGQNTGVGSLSLLLRIFPTQGSNPGLPHCRWMLYQLSHKGSPIVNEGSHKLSCRCCLPPALQHLLRSWGNARRKVSKETGLAPDNWGAHKMNEFSELRALCLVGIEC